MAQKKQHPKVISFQLIDSELRQRIERLATLERRTVSQFVRIAAEDVVEAKEKELGLPPIEEDAEFLATANG